MANPTAKIKSETLDFSGMALKVSQIQDEDGNVFAPAGAGANIADAETAHDLNSTFSDTEAEAALDALGTKINAILDILEAAGLMADS